MLNKALLQGRLTKDPELHYTTNGKAVATVCIAVERNRKNASGEKETDWINLVVWDKKAELLSKHFAKGQMLIADGSIQTRSYTDKDGNKRTAFEVVVGNIYFADSKKDDGQKAAAQGQTQSYTFPENFEPQQQGFSPDQYKPTWEDVDTDDLPF
jgi:single-strand DNA-binding protein